ncbi:MAG TPA: AI-2E family transporter [Thermoanaerobaculia bacterium]|nr:AI-2E family transporter [Thermoanaerobaculia bacterium]
MDPRVRTPAPTLDLPAAPAPPPAPAKGAAPPRSSRAERVPGWKSLDILRAAALVMGLYLVLRLLWIAHQLLLVAFLGVLFGLAVARATDYLERVRIPRGVGASLIVFGFLGLLYGLGAWSAPTLRQQFTELRKAFPEGLNQVEGWLERRRAGVLGQMFSEDRPGVAREQAPGPAAAAPERPAAPRGTQGSAPPGQDSPESGSLPPPASEAPDSGGSLSDLPKTLSGQFGALTSYLFSFLSSTVAVIGGIILILFTAIYIGAEPRLYHKGLLHLIPHQARRRGEEVLAAIGVTLRRWLVTQLIAMVVIGVLTTIVLKLLGIRAALSLGIIAGLFEFIPLAGPLLSAIPAVAIGFLDSPEKALFVALAYLGIQQVENHILIPMLMREGLDLPPLVTLVGLALLGIVFGFLGMLVAVPLLAAIMVAIKLLYVEDVVGDEVETGLDSG